MRLTRMDRSKSGADRMGKGKKCWNMNAKREAAGKRIAGLKNLEG